jgi:hypothetical protein
MTSSSSKRLSAATVILFTGALALVLGQAASRNRKVMISTPAYSKVRAAWRSVSPITLQACRLRPSDRS